jgi:hypothetical protein
MAAFLPALNACVFSPDEDRNTPLEGTWLGQDVSGDPVKIVFSGNTMTTIDGTDTPAGKSVFEVRGNKLNITPTHVRDDETGEFIEIRAYMEKRKRDYLEISRTLLDIGIYTQEQYEQAVAAADEVFVVPESDSISYSLSGDTLTLINFDEDGSNAVLIRQ